MTIEDDEPVISVTGLDEAVGSGATSSVGNWTHDFGADLPEVQKITVNGTELTLIDGGSVEVKGQYGTLKVNADGTYTYAADPNVSGSDSFTFSITDADNDTQSATLTVTVEDSTVKPGNMAFTTQDANVGDKGSDSMTLELAEGVTLTQAAVDAVNKTIDYGKFSLSDDGKSLIFTQTDVYSHAGGEQNEDSHTFGQVSFDVTDANGNATKLDVTVTIEDDKPVIKASISTSINPGGSGNNLVEYDEVISFTEGLKGEQVKTSWWNGQVEISAAEVTYNGTDKWGNPRITHETTSGVELAYSSYNGGGPQSIKGGGTRPAPETDWGLTVNGGEGGDWEIQADKNTSEAVVIELEGLAYGFTVNFGAFFSGGSNTGTGWDTKSEKALIAFYKDGKLVYSDVVEGQNTGEFMYETDQVILEGFGKVVISAVDNGEDSDFTIQSIDFITKRDDAIIVSKGEVKAESGADGFAGAYEDNHVSFDLESMVGGPLNEDGTGSMTVFLADGSEQTLTLSVHTGASGDSILTGKLNGNQVFTAELDKNGNWKMEQYEEFQVKGENGEPSNQFELIFKTEDGDGDVATTTVNVPLELKSQETNDDGSAIGNSDDTITITGGDGIAGTVAAGDSGGMTEGQQVEANYNVCFILDMSSSMKAEIGGRGEDKDLSRLDAAVVSIQNFISSIESNSEFTEGSVNIAVIPFAKNAEQPIEITVTKKSTGEITYKFNGISSDKEGSYDLDDITSKLANEINKIDKEWSSIWNPENQTTNYGSGFDAAASWYNGLGSEVEEATNNITYFLTDGRPAGARTDDANKDDYQKAWEGYPHTANGWFDTDNGIYAPYGVEYQKPEKIDTSENYYVELRDGSWQKVSYEKVGGHGWGDSKSEWGFYTTSYWGKEEWHKVESSQLHEPIPVPGKGGTSQQVTDTDSLTAAFESGFKPGALASAGNDTITAEESASSAIIYGDVMNTDMLLHELYEIDAIKAVLVIAGIDFGSGSKVFQWLEEHGNSDLLKGTDYEGWSHGDTVKYMLEHHEELGYETRVDGNGKSYLVDADGNVLNMDGTGASMSLDELTGRTGGDDVITGSGADDFIFGQEGDDIISGGLGNDALYGGTGDDILFGDEDKLSEIRSVLGISEGSDAPDIIEAIKGAANNEDALTQLIEAVKDEGNGGDDQLFGGSGDDLLFGMGGNDYLSGGEGEDFLFGGSGNDIIVYDENDYLVDGGSGIDFMVSEKNLSLEKLLTESGRNDQSGPIVNDVEVLITGEKALDLTNINQLAEKYGITLGENANGEETLSLDKSKWTLTQQDDNTKTYTFNDGELTLETNLGERVDMNGQNDAQIQQHMFILQNGQGS